MGRRTIKRRSPGQVVEGKGFRLADEIGYIQDKAADHDGRIVTIAQLILFSTDTGDAWLLDVTDQLAARLARDGDPEPIYLEETDTSFAIEWKGQYLHLHRSRHRPSHHHSRLPYTQDRSPGLIWKFQICLVRS